MSSDTSSDTLASLHESYLQSFPAKAEALAQALGEAEEGGWAPGSLTALATQVHRLAGSAGAYGYAEIHQQAATLNRRMKALIEAGTKPVDAASLRAEVERLIAMLSA